MRVLRNLNPRYQADTYLPAGATLAATVDIARAYERWCDRGPRAELAQQLVSANPAHAIVRGSAPIVAGPPVARPAPVQAPPRRYTVQRGETLHTIARKFECEMSDLARANGLAPPRYALEPGQSLELRGCEG
jgi:membrane-bound lytic murein transglycosylase D